MRILFVCLGNICRSPMAEGVFRAVARERGLDVDIDSAGTSAWHVGEAPDPRAQAAAAANGVDISALRGRQAKAADMEDFDLILAMDEENLRDLQRLAGPRNAGKVKLFLDYAPDGWEREVPDPYYGGEAGFAHVLNLLRAAAEGLADELEKDAPSPARM